MRDLRLIVLGNRAAHPGNEDSLYFGGENITQATRDEKALNKRASLLAGALGLASSPKGVQLAHDLIQFKGASE